MKSMILRYGAYGDLLYLLPVIDRMLADGKELYLHTGIRGLDIFGSDNRFKSILAINPANKEDWQKILDKDIETVNPDEIVNLSNTLEGTLIPGRDAEAFHLPVETRRKLVKGESFYSVGLKVAGYSAIRELGDCGTLVFTEGELAWAQRWREIHRNEFVVLMPVRGSNAQKAFPFAKEIGRKILDYYPDAVLYPTGGPNEALYSFSYGDHRVYPAFKTSFRQVMLMARFADYVLGPETGLLVAAGMWGTPKTMLCTSSSVFQCTEGQARDFSLQAQIDCSPCLRAIYEERDCYYQFHAAPVRAVCTNKFQQETILDAIDMVYRTMRYRRDRDGEIRTWPISVPGVQSDNVRRPEQQGAV